MGGGMTRTPQTLPDYFTSEEAWALAQRWTTSGTVEAQGGDPHTIGRWAAAFALS